MNENYNDKYIFLINDLIIHKKLVLDGCKIMSDYLYKEERKKESFEIIKRGIIHDNSKLENDEFEKFMELEMKYNSLKNPQYVLTDYERERLFLHWSKNRHHPEYFDDIKDMNDIDIIEMVCDWHARSIQYNTDLFEFIKTRQENRFKFPSEIFDKIIKYALILKKAH